MQLERFFMGRIYPVAVLILVLLGYVFGLEFYLNIISICALCVGLAVSHSIRPLIVVLLSYVYQLHINHCPSLPANSDYYFTHPRVGVVISLFVLVGIALIYFLVSNRCVSARTLSDMPMKIPALIMSLAFLANGAFGGDYSLASLAYGAIQIVAFFVVFYVFYLGFKNEDGGALLEYFVYVSTLVALLLVIETGYVYLTGDVIVGGIADKGEIEYGWGISNTAGQLMTALIPIMFTGAVRSKYASLLYFGAASVTLVAIVLTMSRSSILFAIPVYIICCLIACFFGEHRRQFRTITVLGILAVAFFAVKTWDKLLVFFEQMLERGISDAGRFDLWEYAIDSFYQAPIFGKGFFGLHTDTYVVAEFFPEMMHSTPFQLLAAMGVVGLVAYAYYRFETVKLFIDYPSLSKTLVGLSLLSLLGQSLLDNFIFYVQPMFHYSVALAIVCKINDDKSWRARRLEPIRLKLGGSGV